MARRRPRGRQVAPCKRGRRLRSPRHLARTQVQSKTAPQDMNVYTGVEEWLYCSTILSDASVKLSPPGVLMLTRALSFSPPFFVRFMAGRGVSTYYTYLLVISRLNDRHPCKCHMLTDPKTYKGPLTRRGSSVSFLPSFTLPLRPSPTRRNLVLSA